MKEQIDKISFGQWLLNQISDKKSYRKYEALLSKLGGLEIKQETMSFAKWILGQLNEKLYCKYKPLLIESGNLRPSEAKNSIYYHGT